MEDKELIEKEFSNLKRDYEKRLKKSGTSCEDVLRFMVENYKKKVWWWSWEFIGQTTKDGRFLSHRAPARASDLAIHRPDLVEHRKIGRFAVYRVRRENREKVINYIKG